MIWAIECEEGKDKNSISNNKSCERSVDDRFGDGSFLSGRRASPSKIVDEALSDGIFCGRFGWPSTAPRRW